MIKYKFPISIAREENYRIKELEFNKCKKNTLFQAASISKIITSILVMRLVEEKKLNLNSDINNYLKNWKVRDKKGKLVKVTLKQLLSHTAGINVSGFPGYSIKSKIPSIDKLLEGKKPCNTDRIFVKYVKGKYRYSGGGYIIIQKAIEDITQKNFERLVYLKIFRKLNMKNSDFKLRKSQSFKIYPEKAAAGLWSTPEDLSKLLIEIQLSYNGKSNKILSQNSIKKILNPITKAESNFIGLGFFTDKNNFFHIGHNHKFRCKFFGSIKGGKGIIIMTNSEILPRLK